MAFACPAHNHNSNKSDTTVVTMDTGGDGEHVPPGINPPPPPPGS